MTQTDRTLAMFALTALFGGGGWMYTHPPVEPPVEPPIHELVLCDASSSAVDLSCSLSAIEHEQRGWLDEAITRPGSRFSVWLVGRARDDARQLHERTVPEGWGLDVAAAREEFRATSAAELRDLDLGGGGSAILEAIDVATLRLRELGGTQRLVIMSDLREVTPAGQRPPFNLERRVPRTSRFVSWAEEAHLVPDLTGITVRVCGFHSRSAPRTRAHDASHEAALRALWNAVFARLGAPGTELRSQCS